LFAQLEEAQKITQERMKLWNYYHSNLENIEKIGILRRPTIPKECTHNAHMYYVSLAPEINRQKVLDEFKSNNINAVFHYVPLHSSPAGIRFGRAADDLPVTITQSERIIRLPLWIGLTQEQQQRVISVLKSMEKFSR
jgi:dTDP-4-amino-4,6-dideoxygalactose transaminase